MSANSGYFSIKQNAELAIRSVHHQELLSMTVGLFKQRKSKNMRRRKSLWACEVCKKRKQKCDGNYLKNDPCSTCKKLGLKCKYGSKKSPEYIKLLEERVDHLEKYLALNELPRDNDSSGSFCFSKGELVDKPVQPKFLIKNHPIEKLKSSINCNQALSIKKFGDAFEQETSSHKLRTSLLRLLKDENLMNSYKTIYFNDVHSRYPFLQKSYVEALDDERLHLLISQPDNNDEIDELVMDKFFLLMVYAIGSSLLRSKEDASESDDAPGNNHLIFFENALLLNFQDLFEFKSITNIQAMLLLVLYLLRLPNNNIIWDIITNALRMCVHFGLHRRDLALLNRDPTHYLARSKIFWSAYSLERAISNSFGLPYSLNDRDIDEELPLDIDENEAEDNLIRKKFFQTYPQHNHSCYDLPDASENPSRTSISLAIQCFHLRRLDSYIQSSLYRLDKNFEEVPRGKIFKFQKKMRKWISGVPTYLTASESDYCLYLFNKHIRSLIQPFLKQLSSTDALFLECMKSSITVCNLSKRIHQTSNRRPSSVSLQTVFLSGVTIIQGILCDKIEWSQDVSEALKSCTTVLSLLTEKLEGYNNYRTLFQRLMQRIYDEHINHYYGLNLDNDLKKSHGEPPIKDKISLPGFSDRKDIDLFGQEALRRRVHESHMRENISLFDELNKLQYNSGINVEHANSLSTLNLLFGITSSDDLDLTRHFVDLF